MRFWVGGYTAGAGGDAEGIGVLHAGEADSPWASGQLGMGPTAVVEPGSPSWLAAHPSLDVVYAALEGAGTVQAYRRTGDQKLVRFGAPRPAGDAVCHVGVSPDGRFLLASCWGDGRVVKMGVDASGALSTPSLAPSATDPYRRGEPGAPVPAPEAGRDALAAASRALREAAGEEYAHLVPDYDGEDDAPPASGQATAASSGDRVSRAHESIFLSGGLVATTDVGFDLVRIWRPGSEGGLRLAQEVSLPLGCGPRHGVWHPSGHLYVVTEHSREVFVLAPDREGRWSVVSGEQLLGTLDGDTGAELAMSRDGATLYAGVRGSDTLGVLTVRGGGEAVQMSALVEAGTRWPRFHTVVRDSVLVAGQYAGEIVTLLLDERTGIPGRPRHRVSAPSPTSLLPFR